MIIIFSLKEFNELLDKILILFSYQLRYWVIFLFVSHTKHILLLCKLFKSKKNFLA